MLSKHTKFGINDAAAADARISCNAKMHRAIYKIIDIYLENVFRFLHFYFRWRFFRRLYTFAVGEWPFIEHKIT